MSPGIIFNGINVNVENENATISIGRNRSGYWRGTIKTNNSNSECVGVNFITNSINNVMDNDVVDAPYNGKIYGNLSKGQAL